MSIPSFLVTIMHLTGIVQIVLAASHVLFPKSLGWREELARLSPVNRQIFWVHTYFIVLILLLFGLLAVFFAPELTTHPSRLAKAVVAGQMVFWAFRLYAQFFVYTPDLWRGHRRNTMVHIVFTALWLFLATVYAAVLIYQVQAVQSSG